MKFFFLSLNDSAPIPLRDPLFAFLAPGISCLPTFCLSAPHRSPGLSSTKSLERAEARRGIHSPGRIGILS